MTRVDPEYVAARRVLLDVLDALSDHLDALVLVGAQAVYLRTVPLPGYPPHTTDADLTIDPNLLAARPGLETAMRQAGLRLKNEDTGHPEPGIWEAHITVPGRIDDLVVPVDLIVPTSVAPPGGRRGVRLGGEHGKRAARKTTGLEGALVDHSPIEIRALDDADPRRIVVDVAGHAALLVAKVHKIDDRREQPDRLTDKDAGDVLRIFMSTTPESIGRDVCLLLDDPRCADVTRIAVTLLDSLFGTPRSLGTRMAVRALTGILEAATVQAACTTFVGRLLTALEENGFT